VGFWRADLTTTRNIENATCRECKAAKLEGRPRFPTCRFYSSHYGVANTNQTDFDGDNPEPNLRDHWHPINHEALPCAPWYP
jgi:hypothetical protein